MSLDPITTVLDIGSRLIDKLWPNPTERDAAKLKLLELQQTGELTLLAAETDLAKGQLAVNLEEAKNASVFVSGGRPFVMWVCGAAFAYAAIVDPFARFVAAVAFGYTGVFPVINTDLTMQVLFGILGLGGLRSWDKKNGVAAK